MNLRPWVAAFLLILAVMTAGTRMLKPVLRSWVEVKAAGIQPGENAAVPVPALRLAPEKDPHRLENYAFDPASPLESRIGAPPASVLEFWRAVDAAPQYRVYAPSAAEKKQVMAYLALLPPAYSGVLTERCVGIWFVSGFKGYGLAEWIDGDGKVYVYLLLNSALLKESLSQVFTARERSCFSKGGGLPSVEAGTKYGGLLYGLAHEGAHALDYVKGVTPYTEKSLPQNFWPTAPLSGWLFWEVWSGHDKPIGPAAYPLRDKVTFYGFSGGPKLAAAEADVVYEGLKASPFVSLYGSLNWADDFAELAALGIINGRLKQPYRIRYGKGRVLEPMRKKETAARAAAVVDIIEKIK